MPDSRERLCFEWLSAKQILNAVSISVDGRILKFTLVVRFTILLLSSFRWVVGLIPLHERKPLIGQILSQKGENEARIEFPLSLLSTLPRKKERPAAYSFTDPK